MTSVLHCVRFAGVSLSLWNYLNENFGIAKEQANGSLKERERERERVGGNLTLVRAENRKPPVPKLLLHNKGRNFIVPRGSDLNPNP